MAIDPVTAKILAQVALKAASDEESRKRIFIIILAPVLFLLLLIALILYLITSPFSMLAGLFGRFLRREQIEQQEQAD